MAARRIHHVPSLRTQHFHRFRMGHWPLRPIYLQPVALDPKQWARVAKDAGFSRLIITAKHHDGEVAEVAKEMGLGLGLYLSPWDRHESSYGRTLEYNEFFLGQMTELLSNYGEIKEVWLDGSKGEREKDMEYKFEEWCHVIHQLQPGAVIFSDAGPDCRWVGDEGGVAGSTCWSLFNASSDTIGHTDYE
ncbi:hypothetical protein AMTR_s00009p00015960 [Amborella trichopoda]|uniref:alpha-L-fucosidase n=1 Tax=Amborella trichopoda TaxID=13333 RepID=W1NH75_AMBTC|nr:hypothetical protein AMTR_s00009p00015960 [Amborella trichopoda]